MPHSGETTALTPLQKAQKILATKADIKAALQAKGQTVTEVLDSYDENIEAIKTITTNGTFIDSDSNLEISKTDITTVTDNSQDSTLDITIDDAGDTLLEEGAGIEVAIDYSDVTTAAGITAAKIISGNTILGVTGTFTADADAVATNIESGKTAYVNGSKVTGSLASITDFSASNIEGTHTGGEYLIRMKGTTSSKNIVQNNTQIKMYIDGTTAETQLGIAAAKILAGQTILDVNGTATSDANAIAGNIDTGKTAYVNGVKITGTSTAAADLVALQAEVEQLRQDLADITSADDAQATMATIISNLESEVSGLRSANETLQANIDAIEAVLDQINGEQESSN